MALLSAELMAQIKRIELKAKHLVSDVMSGQYASAFKGRGMEFDEVREYQFGDDVRFIDWNVTARMGSPYVKVFREERELSIILMLDVSGSQHFATGEQTKLAFAAQIAAVIAFLTQKNNDRVGLVLFSDHIESYIPPSKGRSHIWHIIRQVLTHKSKGAQTNISVPLEFLLRTLKRRSLCFLVSDFWCDSAYDSLLKKVSRYHELLAVMTSDPSEVIVKNLGMMQFEDAESQRSLGFDSSNTRLQSELDAFYKRYRQNLSEQFKSLAIDHIQLKTSDDIATGLAKLMRMHQSSGGKR